MYSREFKKSNRVLFYTSFGKYMSKNKSLYDNKNKWLNYSTHVKPIYVRLNTSSKIAAVNIDIQHKDVEIRNLFYAQFIELKIPFESILGNNWDWNISAVNESNVSCSRISIQIHDVSIFDKGSWPKIFEFFKINLMNFDQFWHEFNEPFKQLSD
jgi:hypothetical protein